jgi:hypothetical protein
VTIRLHIERLVLDGLPVGPGGAARLQAAMQAELARLLASGRLNPALRSGGAIPELPAGATRFDRGPSPARMGVLIARSVYDALTTPDAR